MTVFILLFGNKLPVISFLFRFLVNELRDQIINRWRPTRARASVVFFMLFYIVTSSSFLANASISLSLSQILPKSDAIFVIQELKS